MGAAISLRQFTNNAFPQHHGMQPEERVGIGVDEDGDGFTNELTRADITAVTLYLAKLPVPGQVIPDDPEVREAVQIGEQRFSQIGCASCRIAKLLLVNNGWIYTEPNPFNPSGNLSPAGSSLGSHSAPTFEDAIAARRSFVFRRRTRRSSSRANMGTSERGKMHPLIQAPAWQIFLRKPEASSKLASDSEAK
jgi:hypothetical protein